MKLGASDLSVLDVREESPKDQDLLLEWLTDGHFDVDDTWRFSAVSERAAQLLGFSPEALRGLTLWDVFPTALGTPFELECRAAMRSRRPGRFVGPAFEHLGSSTTVYLHPIAHGLRLYYRESAQQLTDQLRALAAERTRLEQRERRRLALVLHDRVQQLLVAARMQVETIIRQPDLEETKAAAQRAASILGDAIASSRALSDELSPPVLYQSGLAAGLGWLADQMEQKHDFRVHLDDQTGGKGVSEGVASLLFDSTRELLLNCAQHSGAREACVTLSRSGDHQIKVTVEDKGRGFDLRSLNRNKPKRRSVGLFSIQQRLTYFGGRMEIEAVPGQGVRVTLIGPPEEK